MRCYAIIGAKKCGKTYLAKSKVRDIGAPFIVFDKNREWGAKKLPRMSEFLTQAQGVTGHVIIWEDATIFFPNNGRSQQLVDILTAARHTRNTSFLLFHSLRSVPLYVIDHLDGMFILPTRDLSGTVADKFGDWPEVLNGWGRVMAKAKATGMAKLTDAAKAARYPCTFVEL